MASTAIFAVLAVALVAGVNARLPKRIVNGSPATDGEFPYQVSLRVEGQHICGGSIVAPNYVITAAHCVTPMAPTEVVAGTIYSFGGTSYRPAKIQYHAQYTPGVATSPFDIAVIELADDIVFDAVQNMIALPSAPTPAGVMATASGWGYLSASLPLVTPSLNKIVLKTISGEECLEKFGPGGQIYPNQICTLNGAGYGVCGGDSGGPLAYNNELIGVVSWGVPCGIGLPDVFTSIYHHLAWLNSVMKN